MKMWMPGLSNGAPANKLVLGIPAYGRTWHLDPESNVEELPVTGLEGPGAPGPQTKEAGLLSYPEICTKVENVKGVKGGNTQSQFKKISDSRRQGVYAYHKPTENEEEKEGVWIGYEDPESAANKALYAKSKGLGGIAVDDITLDDFRGVCGHSRFAILKSAVNALL
nr:unnamed protein product [Callosobruchus analis]